MFCVPVNAVAVMFAFSITEPMSIPVLKVNALVVFDQVSVLLVEPLIVIPAPSARASVGAAELAISMFLSATTRLTVCVPVRL